MGCVRAGSRAATGNHYIGDITARTQFALTVDYRGILCRSYLA